MSCFQMIKKKNNIENPFIHLFFLPTTREQKQLTSSSIWAHYDTSPTTEEGLTHVQNFL